MNRKYFPFILVFLILLTACSPAATVESGAETPLPALSSTPDLCSTEKLPEEVAKVNKLMREFDDYSSLASNTPQGQLINIIPDMQRILRDTEDLQVPVCLQTLKNLGMAHMDLVIQILMAFLNSSNAQADTEAINAGIAQARDLHTKYDVEVARLLGITLVAPPTVPAGTTPEANVIPPTAVTAIAYVSNPGPSGVNLRSSPGLNAPEAGMLNVQTSTAAIGKSADAQWIKVEVPGQPGQTAWVFATLVQLSIPIEQLPVIE
jgi:hypothetical protein